MHALPEDIQKYQGSYDDGYEMTRMLRYQRLKRLRLIHPTTELSPPAGNWGQVKHRSWEKRCMEVYAAMIDRMDRELKSGSTTRGDGSTSEYPHHVPRRQWRVRRGYGRGEQINDRWTKAIKDNQPMGANELQPKLWPPMKTRDGKPVRGGPEVMPGPDDTYIAYGRHWANVSTPLSRIQTLGP